MAKKAKVASQVTLGRNFLEVSLFKKFLDEAGLGSKTSQSARSCYQRCMQGATKIEVIAEKILDDGLVQCSFRCRGSAIESILVPAYCLEAIQRAPMKVPVYGNSVRDFLARERP